MTAFYVRYFVSQALIELSNCFAPYGNYYEMQAELYMVIFQGGYYCQSS